MEYQNFEKKIIFSSFPLSGRGKVAFLLHGQKIDELSVKIRLYLTLSSNCFLFYAIIIIQLEKFAWSPKENSFSLLTKFEMQSFRWLKVQPP